MPATSAKNGPISGAYGYGLGDNLHQQVEDETEEARKRRLLQEQMKSAVNPVRSGLGITAGAAPVSAVYG
jgi:hypothetical protein